MPVVTSLAAFAEPTQHLGSTDSHLLCFILSLLNGNSKRIPGSATACLRPALFARRMKETQLMQTVMAPMYLHMHASSYYGHSA